MKKLPAKILSLFALGILSVGSLFTFAQGGGFGTQDPSYNPSVPGSTALAGDSLITTIKTFVNRLLGILALIALIILIWGGFQMVTAAGDEAKYKKGFKILQQAAIGLIFIGVSRLVVSVIFWLFTSVLGF